MSEPLEDLAGRFGDDVALDDVGLRCVPVDVARRLLDERRTWWERFDEDRRRLAEQAKREPIVVGVPAVEGLSAVETGRRG
jgi:hypothetical protein